MARSSFALLFFMTVVLGASAGAFTPQNYWETVLPNTPIPSALRQLLSADGKANAVDSSLWGVGVSVGTPGVGVTVGTPGVGVTVGTPGVGVTVGTPGVGVIVGSPASGGVGVSVFPFNYQYAASETQVHDNADVAIFFLEKDLVPGATMKLQFTKTVSAVAFLPRSVANSLPFSSAKLQDILRHLSVKPDSDKAAIIKNTLHTCEQPAVKGEARYCATSLESMVDFSTASLGSRNLLALSTEVSKPNSPKQSYTIASSGVKKLPGSKAVACHAQSYAYAVYYCHATRATKSYSVSLVGKDGTKVDAVVVCHTDTSSWNPKHIAFQLLKVSPGAVPVCHYLPPDHVVWARRA